MKDLMYFIVKNIEHVATLEFAEDNILLFLKEITYTQHFVYANFKAITSISRKRKDDIELNVSCNSRTHIAITMLEMLIERHASIKAQAYKKIEIVNRTIYFTYIDYDNKERNIKIRL